jgi:hypothetical protein
LLQTSGQTLRNPSGTDVDHPAGTAWHQDTQRFRWPGAVLRTRRRKDAFREGEAKQEVSAIHDLLLR